MSKSKVRHNKPKRSYVDVAKFVATWCNCSTVLEVSERLNLSYANCKIRAKSLEKSGVNIPTLPSGVSSRGRKKTDADALNKMIKEIRKAKAV